MRRLRQTLVTRSWHVTSETAKAKHIVTEYSAQRDPDFPHHWGLWAIIFGAVSMGLVFVQIAIVMNQETASIGEQIGQIAGDIKRSAWQSLRGIAPEPEPVPYSQRVFEVLFVATPFIAGTGMILAAVSLLKKEDWHFGFYGMSFGIGAIVFQFVWWMAILILGMLLLTKIVENIGDIFSFGG